MDEPTFTNPVMYSVINSRRSIPDSYSQKYKHLINFDRIFQDNNWFPLLRLVEEGILEQEAIQKLLAEHTSKMSLAFQKADSYAPAATASYSQVGEAQSKALKVQRKLIIDILTV